MPDPKIRETFDRRLEQLQDETLILGSMVEQAVLESLEALKRRDREASLRVFAYDEKINQKRFSIEEACISLIATQQPAAHDLRLLVAILEVSTELERIGDYAKGIAHINLLIGQKQLVKPLIDIPRMAEIAVDMMRRALKAFVNGDARLARSIPAEDDQVDGLYNQVYRDHVTQIMANPATIDQANYLLWVAHNLERMADRVINICERTIYVVTGEMMDMSGADLD
jgi:phosphate transport system protein